MTETRQLYRSIDDYLGPGETRFFASGYRRAHYQVTGVTVTAADAAEPGAHATVSIRYPQDWSTKAERTDLRPHLSTVDMLVLGVQLSEAHLAHAYGLGSDLRRAMWLQKVTLRAGQVPQEDLTSMPGAAMLRSTTPVPGMTGEYLSVYECEIGVMRARCEIVHPLASRADGSRDYQSLDDALGPAQTRYYGEGFKYRRQLIEDVSVDMGELLAAATVRIEPVAEVAPPADGIEGSFQPAASMIDCFVTSLQLGQVLLYELDSIPRARSSTLWMLRTVLEAGSPHRPCAGPLTAEVAITGKHLLPLRGGTWRNVDFASSCGGIALRASFAHQIPDHSPSHSK